LFRVNLNLFLALLLLALNSRAVNRPGAGRDLSGKGKQIFISYCSACHGIDGRGGEHAPGIATAPSVRQLSDARLLSILQNGIPSGGMPAFGSLGPQRLKLILNYLRVLQGRQAAMITSGNPAHGRKLFFGAAGCSNCHMIHGIGGFLGPDLSDYSLSHSPGQIRQAILNPNKHLASESDTVIAITRDGRKFVGIARNEDNFSLQLQTADGSLHLFLKSGLLAVRHEPWSIMPSDYRSKLTGRELRDLISFLAQAGN
jgi:cytochrome c oxidase cbb3-type subunit 3